VPVLRHGFAQTGTSVSRGHGSPHWSARCLPALWVVEFTVLRSGTTMTMASNNEWAYFETRYAHGTLKNLDVQDVVTPLDELRSYLLIKQEALGNVSPFLVEGLVGDIFRGLGFDVVQTAYSKDGGIDLYLLTKDGNRLSAVQVKRQKKRVGVEAIRSFMGVLLIDELTQGVFVSTSGFTRDAHSLSERIIAKNLARIELRDSRWMFDVLKTTQRPTYGSIYDRYAPFNAVTEKWESLPIVESGGEELRWPY
jgi:hypothetical protein